MLVIRYNGFDMDRTTEEISNNWYEFINQEYYLFRGNSRKTISDFAEWFDLPQGQLSQYMKKDGRIPKGLTVINKFVKRLGPKVYDVLGIEQLLEPSNNLPSPLDEINREFRESAIEYQVFFDSPEAKKLLDEIMKKHGYSRNVIDDPSSEK